MIFIALPLIFISVLSDDSNPHIIFKNINTFQLVWENASFEPGAIWSVINNDSQFCSIGDIATKTKAAPTLKAVLVSSRKRGALVNPTSFTQVWNVTGNTSGIFIYRMHAPEGYTCLGDVAVDYASQPESPDTSRYCCIKNDYVVYGQPIRVFGMQSHSLWTVIRSDVDAYGVLGGNFVYGPEDYLVPRSTHLLRDDGVKVRGTWNLPAGEYYKPLSLYEVTKIKEIWNDKGSGVDSDVSIWRAISTSGCYSLGDIVVGSYSRPNVGYFLRQSYPDDDLVRLPVSYTQIWDSDGSGAHKDVKLWIVNCPEGYVSVGGVATNGKTKYPLAGRVYCVKSTYTLPGSSNNWGEVWKDKESKALENISIFTAQTTSSQQLSVRGFGAIQSFSSYPAAPRLLNRAYVQSWAEIPTTKIYVDKVDYDFGAGQLQTSSLRMSPTVLLNLSDVNKTIDRIINFSVAESSTFVFIDPLFQRGTEVKFTAGMPVIGTELHPRITASQDITFRIGDITMSTQIKNMAASIDLPRYSKITAVITGTEYRAEIPYTADIRRVFYDKSKESRTVRGVYKGLIIADLHVSYLNGAWSPFSDWTNCSAACGPGIRTRKRVCSNLISDGADCLGEASQLQYCYIKLCENNTQIWIVLTSVVALLIISCWCFVYVL